MVGLYIDLIYGIELIPCMWFVMIAQRNMPTGIFVKLAHALCAIATNFQQIFGNVRGATSNDAFFWMQ